MSSTSKSRLQRVLLEHLGKPGAETRLAQGGFGFQRIANHHLPDSRPHEVQEAIWSLVAQGLAYLDTSQIEASNWAVRITAAGRAVLSDEDYNPHDPAGYMDRLRAALPDMSDTVLAYMTEALGAFNNQLYLASTVMLGAASEAAFLEVATAFAGTLTGKVKSNFERVLNGKTNYVEKFAEFRKRLEPLKATLPEEYGAGMALMLDSVVDLLRVNRNEAGHPTGRMFDRDDCFTALQMAARYLRKLYGLKRHFDQQASP